MQKWMVIALLAVMSSPALGSGSEPFMGLCDHCNSNAQFEVAAENLAPNFAPGDGSIKVYPVYVTNPMTADVRFFQVAVWYDWQGGQPQTAPEPLRAREIRIPSGKDGESVVYGPGLQKLATPAPGDPSLKADLVSASIGLQAFISSLQGVIDVGDLPWPGHNPPPASALDLIGTVPGQVSLQHGGLEIALSQYLNQRWAATITFVVRDVVDRLFRNYGGESDVFRGRHATIRWPDGTTIVFAIDRLSLDLSGISYRVFGDVLQSSITMPDGGPGPWGAGMFDGFTWRDNADLGPGLIGAAHRSGELNCSFSCVDKHDENVTECVLSCSPN